MKLEKIIFAGHSSIFLASTSYQIAIDPWLNANPSCPAGLKSPAKLDLILLTHAHSDHASEAAALAKSLGSKLAATWELANIMNKEGVPSEKTVYMNKGGTVNVDGLNISLTHAMHSSSYDTQAGALYAGEPGGFVVNDGHNCIYHAGDTALFSDMSLIKEFYRPNIALLPIGDRFTMGAKEAAYAAKLVGAKIAIPIHFKTFDLLAQNADEFVAECKRYEIRAVVLEPGQSFQI